MFTGYLVSLFLHSTQISYNLQKTTTSLISLSMTVSCLYLFFQHKDTFDNNFNHHERSQHQQVKAVYSLFCLVLYLQPLTPVFCLYSSLQWKYIFQHNVIGHEPEKIIIIFTDLFVLSLPPLLPFSILTSFQHKDMIHWIIDHNEIFQHQ